MRRSVRNDYLVALGSGLAALALYGRTLAPGVLGGDSGEFQLAAWLGGLAHPTGYPLYLILGYLWTHLLPLGIPAWRMNLLSALCGALAVGLTYLFALRSLRLAGPAHQPALVYRLLALFAAALFAVNPTFWSQAVVAEVYTFQAVLMAGLWLALVAWAEAPQSTSALYAAAALFGLGLAHHRSVILLLPALFLFLARAGARVSPRPAWRRHLLRALPLLVAPLFLYLYIPLRAPATPYLHIPLAAGQTLELYQPSVGGFLAYVTGQTFGGSLRPVADALRQIEPAARLFLGQVTWPGLLLGALGLIWLSRPRGRLLLVLTGVSFLGIVTFNLFYGIGDIYVFYIPAYLIWSVWSAFGVAGGVALLARLIGRARRLPPAVQLRLPAPPALLGIAGLLALALPGWLVLTQFPALDQSQNRHAELEWSARLAGPIPRDAVLITNDRDEMMPLWYFQYVGGIRTDLIGLFPLILPGPAWDNVGSVSEQALASGRSVWLIKPMPGLDVKLRLQPAGELVQVLGPAVARLPDQILNVDYGEALRLVAYEVLPQPVESAAIPVTTTVVLYWEPLRQLKVDYTTFVHLTDQNGAIVGQDDHRPGGVYYPTSLWRPGELLRDEHLIPIASRGSDASAVAIQVGVYRRANGLQHLGDPQSVGHLPR